MNPRDHRQFVREFIRAVHRTTGKTFSPAIYRRLLGAYAPQRKPSTATLALEKERFVKELERTPSIETGDDSEGNALARDIRQMLEDFTSRTAARAPSGADSYLQAQCDFLQQRLSQSEKNLADAKAAAATADAQRQVLQAQFDASKQQNEALQSSGAAMLEQLGALTRAVDEARQFALLAVDDARGETRAWRERFLATEFQLRAQVSLTETFRRLAYRQGADIPPALKGDPT